MNNNNNAAALLGGMLCVLLVALPIGLAIGAVILRAAIALANKVLGRPADAYDDRADDYDDYDDEDDDRPRRRRQLPRRAATAVPEPSFPKTMGIVLVIALVNGVVGFVIGLAVAAGMGGQADPQVIQLTAQGLSLPVGFLIGSGLLVGMLPTTFPRACLVTLFQYLITLLIVGVIVGAILAVGVGVGGLGR